MQENEGDGGREGEREGGRDGEGVWAVPVRECRCRWRECETPPLGMNERGRKTRVALEKEKRRSQRRTLSPVAECEIRCDNEGGREDKCSARH